jgi:hypothetical protein
MCPPAPKSWTPRTAVFQRIGARYPGRCARCRQWIPPAKIRWACLYQLETGAYVIIHPKCAASTLGSPLETMEIVTEPT